MGSGPSLVGPTDQASKAATFNARAETVADKPFFRDAFRQTRCIIPASGYYEWVTTPNGKQPLVVNDAHFKLSLSDNNKKDLFKQLGA